MTDDWQRIALRVFGPFGSLAWRRRFRQVGPCRSAIDDPDMICELVERGLRPWREKYATRY